MPSLRLFVAALLLLFAGALAASAAPVRVDGIERPVDVSGVWTARRGDDPAWAKANDDGNWAPASAEEVFGVPGFASRTGFTWLRADFALPWGREEAERHADLGVSFAPIEYGGYEVFAGGERIAAVGSSPDRPRAVPSHAEVVRIPATAIGEDGRLLLAVRVWRNPAYAGAAANDFEHKGTLGPFAIGPYDALRDRVALDRARALDADTIKLVCAAIFALVGLYHLQLYSRRRQLREYLWFGILSLVAATNVFFASAWPDSVMTRLLSGSIALAALHVNSAIWISFTWTIFGWRVGRWMRAYQALQLVLAAIAVLAPTTLSIRLGLWPIGTMAPILVVWFFYIPREAWRGNRTARTICFGLLFLAAARAAQFLAVFEVIPVVNFTHWGFVALIFSMAVSLSNRFARVYERLDALNQDLEGKVARRTTELDETVARLRASERDAVDARETAVAANDAKSVFLANVSHELRTPLNAILGFVQLMRRDRTLGDTSRERLDVISRSGEHLLGLINDILSIAKIESGRTALEVRPFALRPMLDGVDELFRLRAETKGLTLETEIADDLPAVVRGDEAKLRQVLINLLGNAVKFTDRGSVVLRARWRDGRATFEVTDTGRGIASEEMPTLFVPFTQAQAGREANEGTGLGLTISRDIARLMDGDIAVASEPGVGSTFRVDVALPAAGLAVASEPARVAVGLEPDQPARRVLVTDDNAENRSLLVALMESVGFEVRSVSTGVEAVKTWAEWRPHIVWMDVRMPSMDGVAATREIREREEDEGIERCVVVALTASVFEQDRAALLDAGCDDFVAKPFRAETLFDLMAERLGVRFVYEVPALAAAAAAARGGDATPAVRRLPRPWIAELERLVAIGDVEAANAVIDRIGATEAELAAELRRLVRAYRFDELQRLMHDGTATDGTARDSERVQNRAR